MEYYKPLKRYKTLFIVLSITGGTLIGWGTSVSNQSPLFSSMLISLGGALFGASATQIFGYHRDNEFICGIIDTLANSLKPGVVSNENEVSNYRKKFHSYLLTQINGKITWRYTLYDFSKSLTVGKLSSKITTIDKEGNEAYYICEAGIKDDRFFIFEKAAIGTEPTIINIFPFMGKEFHSIHCGICINESWDGTNLVSRCIVSKTPIHGWTKFGTIPDDVARKLDDIWINGFSSNNIILVNPSDIFPQTIKKT